jgi:DNA processing protein
MRKEALFTFFPHATRKRYRDLVRLFGSFDHVLQAKPEDFTRLPWGAEIVHAFIDWQQHVQVEEIERQLERDQIRVITTDDTEFPPLLRQIADPPLSLFVRGSLDPLPTPVAIVGPRSASQYGKQVTQTLSSDLARLGLTIVSGLALGIDGVAHESAVRAGGKTVAVLGSGIDRATLYPRAHVRLADSIVEHGGAIISEYPPGTTSLPYMFPERNRLVAGMSLGTVVIEASLKSGSLITASLALEYCRDVFAVPQNITSPTASGVNNLLKLGAYLVTEAADIARVFNIAVPESSPKTHEPENLSLHEKTILFLLSKEPKHLDELCAQSKLLNMEVGAALTILEIRGLAQSLGSMTYIRL